MVNHTIRRSAFLRHFVNRTPCLIGMEACSAVQQSRSTVAVKTEAQQAVLALNRMRQQLIKFRMINGLRGLLTEYGEVMSKSRAALNKAFPEVLMRLSDLLQAMLIESLCEQYARLTQVDEQITQIERRLQQCSRPWHRSPEWARSRLRRLSPAWVILRHSDPDTNLPRGRGWCRARQDRAV